LSDEVFNSRHCSLSIGQKKEMIGLNCPKSENSAAIEDACDEDKEQLHTRDISA
jgi:hypothetical protein